MTTQPITLTPVDKKNWQAVCRLELAEDQRHYVAPNWYSIIEGHYEESGLVRSVAILAGDTIVGYALYGYFSEDPPGECWLGRLMIAKEHQGKGYGRAAVTTILADMQSMAGCQSIQLGVEPENAVARKLYEQMGFVHEGRVEDGELVYVYKGNTQP